MNMNTPPVPGMRLAEQSKRVGMALLPLAVFVTAALLSDRLLEAWTDRAGRTTVSGNVHHAAGAVHANYARVAMRPVPSFRDERNLVDPLPEPTAYRVAGEQAAAAVPSRTLEVVLGAHIAVPLGLAGSSGRRPGSYAIARGVPQNALMTHGFAVGNDSWLIDGEDLPRAGLSMPDGMPGEVVIELTTLSGNGRMLAQDRLTLAIQRPVKPVAALALVEAEDAAAAASPDAQSNSVLVPEHATVSDLAQAMTPDTGNQQSPSVAEEVASQSQPQPSTDTLDRPATIAAPAAAPPVDFRIAVSAATELMAGTGSLLRLDVEPVDAVPDGVHIVLRGLPADAVLSRGSANGQGGWQLSRADLENVEVRLPAHTNGSVIFEAQLLTSDGRLLAEDKAKLSVGQKMPAGEAATVASLPPIVVMHGSDALPKQPPVPAATAARGRHMLQLGYIAMARPLLERAANEGSGEAAALLALSFDQRWLSRNGVLGIDADADKTRHWQAEARRLGVTDPEKVIALPAKR